MTWTWLRKNRRRGIGDSEFDAATRRVNWSQKSRNVGVAGMP